MAEVIPIPAASVLLLRKTPGGSSTDRSPYQVLMIRRTEAASFVPNVWVFPGGVAEEHDGEVAAERGEPSLLNAMRVASIRELFEEAGIWLGGPLDDSERKRRRLLAGSLDVRTLFDESPIELRRLVWTSHWITPAAVTRRFDTYFFLAQAPAIADATVISDEAVEARWITPEEAIAGLKMVLPTIRNLEAIRGFANVPALLESRVGIEIPTVIPVMADGKITIP